jgi:hypothetical protein
MKELARTNYKEKLFKRKIKYWIRLLETDLNFPHPIIYHVTKVHLEALKDSAIAQAVSHRFPTGSRGSSPGQNMWDLW